MIRYTVYFNGEQVKSYDIEEPAIFIGRLPENHIPIFNMGISRRHVKIELDAFGTYTLTDLNSLNGTLVNGKKVKKATLANGDKITIGKYTIVYEDLRGEAALHLETIVAEFRPEDMQRIAPPQQFGAPQSIPAPQAFPPPQAFPSAPVAMPPPMAAPQPYQPTEQPPTAMPPPMAAPQPYQPTEQPPTAMPPPMAAPQPYQPTEQPPTAMPPPMAAPQPYRPTEQPPQAAPQPTVNDSEDEEALSGAVLIETTDHIRYRLDRDYITIGSDETDDIYAKVSKNFAVIEQRDGGFYITVQKMIAKIKVNGKGVRTHKLEHRDRIEIGSNTFRFMENG